jgi:hypothetical protein
MFGNPKSGFFLNPPDADLKFELSQAEIARPNQKAVQLYYDIEILIAMAKVCILSTLSDYQFYFFFHIVVLNLFTITACINLFIYLFIYLFICLSLYLLTYLINLFVYFFALNFSISSIRLTVRNWMRIVIDLGKRVAA